MGSWKGIMSGGYAWAGLAFVTGGVGLLTVVWPAWIDQIFPFAGGDAASALERSLVFLFAFACGALCIHGTRARPQLPTWPLGRPEGAPRRPRQLRER